MSARRILVLSVVAAALCAGLAMRDRSLWGMWLRQNLMRKCVAWWHGRTVYLSYEPNHEQAGDFSVHRRRLQRDSLPELGDGTQEELLEYADAHPERPEALWLWFRGEDDGMKLHSTLRELSAPSPEKEKILADAEEKFRVVRARDPDNGWPLVQLAFIEASRGIRYEPASRTGGGRKAMVTDPARAAVAVRLVQEAAGKERVTRYSRDAMNAVYSQLGEPETLEDIWIAMGLGIRRGFSFNLATTRALVDFLAAEASRRIANGTDSGAGHSAYAIFHDLQTVGARMVEASASLFECHVGIACIMQATEKGVGILNETGMTAEADSLYARSVALLRSPLLARMASGNVSLYDIWKDDESLREEAGRIKAARTEIDSRALKASTLLPYFLPNLNFYVPAGERFLAPEDIRITRTFERWAWEKAFSSQLSTLAWAILAALTIMGGIIWGAARKTATPMDWPSLRQVGAASLVFAVPAVMPGVAVAAAGYSEYAAGTAQLLWLLFWNLWGFFAGAILLWLYARSRCAADGCAAQHSRCRPRGVGEWFAAISFAAAVPAACVAYAASDKGADAWGVAALLMLPAFLWVLMVPIRWLAGLATRRATASHGSCLAVAGWSGGLLLWFAAYFPVEWQEREWGRMENILMPRMVGTQYYADSVAEGRIVAELQDSVRAALAEHE